MDQEGKFFGTGGTPLCGQSSALEERPVKKERVVSRPERRVSMSKVRVWLFLTSSG